MMEIPTTQTPQVKYQPRPLLSYAVHVVAQHIRREDLSRIPADMQDHIERHMWNRHTRQQEVFGVQRIWHTYELEKATIMKNAGWCFPGAITCEPCYRLYNNAPAALAEEWREDENGHRHGETRMWNKYGTLVALITYRHGMIHGPYMERHAECRPDLPKKFAYGTIMGNYDEWKRVGKWVWCDSIGYCLQVLNIIKLDPPLKTVEPLGGDACPLSWCTDMIQRYYTHEDEVRFARRWYINAIESITTDIDTGGNWGMQIVEYHNGPVDVDGAIVRYGSGGRSHGIRKIVSIKGFKKHGVQASFDARGVETHRSYFAGGVVCGFTYDGSACTLDQVLQSAANGSHNSDINLKEINADFYRLFVFDLTNYPTMAEIKAEIDRAQKPPC
jgi:hypothetical protein